MDITTPQVAMAHEFYSNQMFKEEDLVLQYQIRELCRRAQNLSPQTKVDILCYEASRIAKKPVYVKEPNHA